jgi:pimeloyl-ACP methyl ester carboxylesterase
VFHETDLTLADGRTLHVYDAGGHGLPVLWQHGTPNIGTPPSPLLAAAERLGVRWVGHDRPGYGGSTRQPGRTVAAVADDAAAVADALGFDRFAVMGHSGGGPHALACAALLPDRVVGVVAASGPAPYDAEGLDFHAGMAAAGVASTTAAAAGREAREALEEGEGEADFGFTPGDEEALGGRWSWFLDVVRPALAAGPAGMIDDDLAAVAPWGFAPEQVQAPVLLLHGEADRVVPPAHATWLAQHLPDVELRLTSGDGHITVMDGAEDALAWMATAERWTATGGAGA